jgi:hypothetical protein
MKNLPFHGRSGYNVFLVGRPSCLAAMPLVSETQGWLRPGSLPIGVDFLLASPEGCLTGELPGC